MGEEVKMSYNTREERLVADSAFYDTKVLDANRITGARKLEYLQQLCMYHNIEYDAITPHDMGIFKYHINVAYDTSFVNTASLRVFVAQLRRKYPSEDKLEPRLPQP